MYERNNSGPAKNVTDLMTNPEGVLLIKELLDEALIFIEAGKGKYGTDGAFYVKEATLGDAVNNPAPGHKMIRNHLLVTAVYSQGLSFVFDKMAERELVFELEDTAMVLKEENINRSLMLMNIRYKANDDLKNGQVTLSSLTSMALTDTPRNRQRVRNKVTPILVAHGIWTMEDVDGEKANFSAGPLLVMFSDLIFGRMKPLDGEDA